MQKLGQKVQKGVVMGYTSKLAHWVIAGTRSLNYSFHICIDFPQEPV
jgi:hypothetical protein